MKICFICKREIAKNNGEICHTCLDFLKWKYKKKFKRILERYRKHHRINKSLGGNKMESYRCSCGAYTSNEDGICDMCEIREIENEASLREEDDFD
jgi:hypothetical protein